MCWDIFLPSRSRKMTSYYLFQLITLWMNKHTHTCNTVQQNIVIYKCIPKNECLKCTQLVKTNVFPIVYTILQKFWPVVSKPSNFTGKHNYFIRWWFHMNLYDIWICMISINIYKIYMYYIAMMCNTNISVNVSEKVGYSVPITWTHLTTNNSHHMN